MIFAFSFRPRTSSPLRLFRRPAAGLPVSRRLRSACCVLAAPVAAACLWHGFVPRPAAAAVALGWPEGPLQVLAPGSGPGPSAFCLFPEPVPASAAFAGFYTINPAAASHLLASGFGWPPARAWVLSLPVLGAVGASVTYREPLASGAYALHGRSWDSRGSVSVARFRFVVDRGRLLHGAFRLAPAGVPGDLWFFCSALPGRFGLWNLGFGSLPFHSF